MLAGAAGLIVHDITEALVPVLIGVVIDRAVLPGDLRALLTWLAVFVALFVVLTYSWRIAARVLIRVAGLGAHDLRQRVVRRVLAARGMAGERRPGEVLAITTSDTMRISSICWLFGEQAGAIAAVVTAAIALLLTSVPLGLVVLIASPAMLLIMHRVSKPLEARSGQEQARVADTAALAADTLTGLRVLKGIGAEEAAATRYHWLSRLSLTSALRAARSHATFIALGDLLSGVVLAGIALFAAVMALDSRITVGEFVAVVGLAQFVHGPMRRLCVLGVEWVRARASADRLAGVLEEPYALPAGDSAAAVSTGDVAALAVRRIPVPDAVLPGFRVAPGELLGVVLADPAHATKLVDVLGFRAAAPPGDVSLYGSDLYRLGPEFGRKIMYAPPHAAALFSATVAENLTTNHGAGALRDDIVNATAVDDVASHLRAGLDEGLPDQGRTLSGGQRQRVALGRALHGGHEVLVLHEPTTAVDTVTESRIAAGLREVTGASIVLVTSSATLLAACDRVVVPDSKTPLSGTHAELLAGHPMYRELLGTRL